MAGIEQLRFWGRYPTPVILQTQAAECALACLAMVAGHHGYDVDLASLRQRYSVSLKGATLLQLIRMAEPLNLASRPLRLELDHLSKLQLPAILHWNFNHFVVLVSVNDNTAIIHDPARGRISLPLSEVSKHFTGVALELSPTQEFKPHSERQRLNIFALWSNSRGLAKSLFQVFVLALVLELFAILSPLLMQLTVDQVIVSADTDLLSALAIGFLLLMLIQSSVGALRAWALMHLGVTLNLQLAKNVVRHLLRLPLDYFEKRHLGDISSRVGSLDTIQRTLTNSFIAAILDGLVLIGTLIMMILYAPGLTGISILALTAYGALRAGLFWPLRNANEEQLVRAAKLQSNFLETVRGIQTVKLFNRESQRHSLWSNLLVDRFNADIRTQRLGITFQSLNQLIFGFENVLIIWLGAKAVLNGGFSVGMLYAYVAYKTQFGQRAAGLIDKWIDLKMLGLHADRLADILLTETDKLAQTHSKTPIDEIAPSIQVRDLSFTFATSEPAVFQHVSFDVAPGETVAIVGPSGCGKTTLLKVVLGLLEPATGEVSLGGHNLHRSGGTEFREMIGTVMQDDQLFAGSIADNITFFDEIPDQERITACAQLAAIHDEIMAMPMTYNSLIGDMGTALSGGQKQRILLARALYRQPRILLLDEATSHLDAHRERLVNTGVRQLKLTTLIVAHRQETIRYADRVIMMTPEGTREISVAADSGHEAMQNLPQHKE